MVILAVDTGSTNPAIGLYDIHRKRYAEFGTLPYGSTGERFFLILRALLNDCNVSIGDIEAACVYTGPGGFTGTRIGISVLMGMRAGSGLPIYGIDGFTLAAYTAPIISDTYRVFIPGGRGTVYAATLDKTYHMTDSPEIIPLSGITLSDTRDTCTIQVEGARGAVIHGVEGLHVVKPSLRDMLALYTTSPHLYKVKDALLPVYVRPPDATPQKDVKRML